MFRIPNTLALCGPHRASRHWVSCATAAHPRPVIIVARRVPHLPQSPPPHPASPLGVHGEVLPEKEPNAGAPLALNIALPRQNDVDGGDKRGPARRLRGARSLRQ